LAAVAEHRPERALIDVRMPPGFTDEGVRAAVEIRRRWPGTPVVLLSQYVEERYAADLLSANTSGVGYLLKQRVADVADFVAAVRRVADGGTALDPQVVAQLLLRRDSDPLARLTRREREVLGLMAEGAPMPASRRRWWSARAPWRSTSTTSSPSLTCPWSTRTTAASWPCCGSSERPGPDLPIRDHDLRLE
jgi:CheY-like chemotaxis protein